MSDLIGAVWLSHSGEYGHAVANATVLDLAIAEVFFDGDAVVDATDEHFSVVFFDEHLVVRARHAHDASVVLNLDPLVQAAQLQLTVDRLDRYVPADAV